MPAWFTKVADAGDIAAQGWMLSEARNVISKAGRNGSPRSRLPGARKA